MKVVRATKCHVCLNAPPGTGKTETLAERILNLIQNEEVSPPSILCVTHTNAAVESMRKRLATVLGEDDANRVHVTTIHSFAHSLYHTAGRHLASVLDRRLAAGGHHGDLYDLMDGLTLDDPVAWVNKRCDLLADEVQRDPSLHYSIGSRKGQPKPLLRDKLGQIDALREAAGRYKNYREVLRKRGRFVHSDLIVGAVRALRESPSILQRSYKHIMVDEYQDLGLAQEELVSLIRQPSTLYMASGDPLQSIYSFNGAAPGAFDRFKTFIVPGEEVLDVTLRINYRSTPSITTAAMRVVGKEVPEVLDDVDPGPRPRVIEYASELAEVAGVMGMVRKLLLQCRPSDIAILVRKHAYAAKFEEALRQVCPIIPSRRLDVLKNVGFSKIRLILRYLVTAMDPEKAVSNERDALLFRLLNSLGVPQVDIMSWWKSKDPVGAVQGVVDRLGEVLSITHQSPITKTLIALYSKILDEDPAYLGIIRSLTVHASDEVSKGLGVDDLSSYLSILEDMIHERIPLDEVPALGTSVDQSSDAISFLTCHASKSMGFPHVIMVGCSEHCWRVHPSLVERLVTSVEQVENEARRVFHVGMSRARHTLAMTFHGKPCRFLSSLGDSVDVLTSDQDDDGEILKEVYLPQRALFCREERRMPSISSTLLIEAEECPLRAYYQRVLGMSLPNPNRSCTNAAATGEIIHNLFEQAFRDREENGVFPKDMSLDMIPESKREILVDHYHRRQEAWERTCTANRVQVEYRLDGVLDGIIPVTGRVDRWDESCDEAKTVCITDYKTGKRNEADLRRKGSKIRTQATFYVFLALLKGFRVKYVEFDFLGTNEPDKVYVSPEELKDIEKRIKKVWENLQSPIGCLKPCCSWCAWD